MNPQEKNIGPIGQGLTFLLPLSLAVTVLFSLVTVKDTVNVSFKAARISPASVLKYSEKEFTQIVFRTISDCVGAVIKKRPYY